MTAVSRSPLELSGTQSRSPVADYAATQCYAHFCDDEAALLDMAAAFLRKGYLAGERLLLIVTETHWKTLQSKLNVSSGDASRVTILEAKSTLASIVRGGALDVDRFISLVGLADEPVMRGYSEMADILWQRGERRTAILLDELWADLSRRLDCTFHGASVMAGFWKDPEAIVSASDPLVRSVLNDGAAESGIVEREVAQLAAHPAELVRRLVKEIAHRREVENVLRESLVDLRREVA
ncbi:MAG TPA: hypothetical protein VIV60_18620, partial [Polyangiaceae bacterium]